jgi:2-oxoglutarate dehydrogenase E2 component (dihydrolipoamide succinyltransferase)
MIEIKVPTVGESINEVTLVKWLKNDGDYVERDEVIAELESEKATFEVNAEQAGVLKTVGKEGDTLNIGDVVAQIDDKAAKPEGSQSEEGSQKEEAGSQKSEVGRKSEGSQKSEEKTEKEEAKKSSPSNAQPQLMLKLRLLLQP